uniref:Ribosomal protein L16 n=1 Tax=Rhodogorgon sp. TaxID=2485824 RepID=A0A3G3MIS3_9FLOR|nr:ribosomal protein L16 [Rhodogorgon sp.]
MIKKSHNKCLLNLTYSRHVLKFGTIGFKAISFGYLTKEQLNSVKWSLTRKSKELNVNKTPKIWYLTFLNKTLTRLSTESRMGKGKGSIYTQLLFVKPGFILFEFSNISKQQAFEIFMFVRKRISIKIAIIYK